MRLLLRVFVHCSEVAWFIAIVLIQNIFTASPQYANYAPQWQQHHELSNYIPDYEVYHNLASILFHLNEMVERNPQYMRLDTSHVSRLGRLVPVLQISNFSDSRDPLDTTHPYWSSSKVRLLMLFGEHAGEFFPIESMFHLLKNLTQGLTYPLGSSEERFSRKVLSKIDIFIVAMYNPDGRSYIEEKGDYCWQGTSTGVDLSTNFEWNSPVLPTSHQQSTRLQYTTNRPFSEPETSLTLYLTSKYRFDAFISFHSGSREIHIPFSDEHSRTIGRKPKNVEAMLEVVKLMSHSTTPKFIYGQAFYVNRYPFNGANIDYMAAIKKIPFSLRVELWGDGGLSTDQCFLRYNPINHKLMAAVKEVHPLYETLFYYLIEWKENRVYGSVKVEREVPSLLLCYFLLTVVVFLTVIVACRKRLSASIGLRIYPQRRVISLKTLGATLHVS